MQRLVIKCGGSTLDRLPASFYEDLVQLSKQGWEPVIVHGGGPAISRTLEQMGIAPNFIDGLRVTDAPTLEVVKMVLLGQTNKQVVGNLEQAGGKSVGISGIDGSTIRVSQGPVHLGFVGVIDEVNPALLETVLKDGWIPVVAPLGVDEKGQVYNINADTAAGAVAGALGVEQLVMVTDVPGVMKEIDGEKQVLPQLTEAEIEQLIADGVIYGGMIPKVRAALDALGNQVKEVLIINGYEPGILVRVANGEPVGTKILKEEVTA